MTKEDLHHRRETARALLEELGAPYTVEEDPDDLCVLFVAKDDEPLAAVDTCIMAVVVEVEAEIGAHPFGEDDTEAAARERLSALITETWTPMGFVADEEIEVEPFYTDETCETEAGQGVVAFLARPSATVAELAATLRGIEGVPRVPAGERDA